MNARAADVDVTLVGLWLAVSAIGVAMVGSASMEMASAASGAPFAKVVQHLGYLGVSGLAVVFVITVPLSFARQFAYAGGLLAIVLLALVLVPGIGREVNGASRWFNTPFITIQASEFAKPLYLLLLARLIADAGTRITEPRVLLRVMAPFGPIAVLLICEPDFGTTVVLGTTTLVVLFLGGARLWHLGAMALLVSAAIAVVGTQFAHVMDRMLFFLDPWADEYGKGYQLTQALIAFGRGAWDGVGIGDSVQKLFYLPEAHNDFLLAVIAEETGLIGVAVLLSLLIWLSLHVLAIGRRAQAAGQTFAALLASGIGTLIAIQTLVNVFVNVGLLPTKGLTLPFVSYGGNSLVVCAALVALAMRVAWETPPPTGRPSRGGR